MVLGNSPKSSQVTAVSDCQLTVESGRVIHYVAPSNVNPVQQVNCDGAINYDFDAPRTLTRKRSSYDANDESDDWEGVNTLCQTLDTVLRYDCEHIVKDKNVLELGFCTGLPSVFSLENGASHATLYCADDVMLSLCVKPTLARNKIKHSQRKFISGDISNLKSSTEKGKYDVILAAEFLNTDRAQFDQLHDLIDHTLARDGVCLLTARMCYFNNEGSLPEFLDLVKTKSKFEVYTRWTSPKSDLVQRKVLQLTRTIR